MPPRPRRATRVAGGGPETEPARFQSEGEDSASVLGTRLPSAPASLGEKLFLAEKLNGVTFGREVVTGARVPLASSPLRKSVGELPTSDPTPVASREGWGRLSRFAASSASTTWQVRVRGEDWLGLSTRGPVLQFPCLLKGNFQELSSQVCLEQ